MFSFETSLDVLYGGLQISKLQFLSKKINFFFSFTFSANFSNFWLSKPRIWIRIRIRTDLKCWIRNTGFYNKQQEKKCCLTQGKHGVLNSCNDFYGKTLHNLQVHEMSTRIFKKTTFSHGSDLQTRADLSAIPLANSPYLQSAKYPSLESVPITFFYHRAFRLNSISFRENVRPLNS